VKKTARGAVAFAAWASGSLLARRAFRRGPRVRAITYHRFGDRRADPFSVGVRAFERQMQWLARRGSLASLDDVAEFVAGRRPLRDDAVLVTVDDGCRSLHSDALPVLREYAVPAVAFVTAGLVGMPPGAGDSPEPYLTWSELEQLAAAGIAIGSHAFTHRSLGGMGIEEVRDQAQRSRELLERRLGGAIRSFAYPFGTRADFSPLTERVLAECGYRCVFHAMHGAIRAGMDPIRLPRVKIEGGEGLRMFQLSCRGAMDAWLGVDYALWRVQKP
jgi:peptidoglycan/xylan/chitin deacetylase (PgdA/CDA1 family)